MGAKSKTTYRFAFQITSGGHSGLGGGSWRVWVQGSDIYVTDVNLGKIMKASLHASGRWRIGYTAEHMRSERPLWDPQKDRGVWKFDAAPFDDDGIQRAFVIATPRSALRPHQPGPKDTVIQLPDRWDSMTGVLILVALPGTVVDQQALVFDHPLLLKNGNSLWLKAFEQELDPAPLPEPIPESQLLAVLTPESDGVSAPGFMLKGVNVDRTPAAVSRSRPPHVS